MRKNNKINYSINGMTIGMYTGSVLGVISPNNIIFYDVGIGIIVFGSTGLLIGSKIKKT
ncbi:MAG: hypothetical protein R3Y64_03850 [Peptostreptococcaceae bacterium]